MEKNKKTILQAIVCVGLLCVIWGGYWLTIRKMERNIKSRDNNFSWVFQLDEVEKAGTEVMLRGFAFELDADAQAKTYEIVLQDIETGEIFFPDMKYESRADVNEYFLCDYDYEQSGFVASIKDKKISLKEKNYEVLLRVKDEKETYRTGTYLKSGQIVYANPNEFTPLNVVGTELEKVVKDGVLRVYRPDYGIYVYQYKGELYWIAEPNYGFVDGDTFIEYHLNTTQVANLPKHRLENHWYWDNRGFDFSKCELTDWNTGRYRVAKMALPKEYKACKDCERRKGLEAKEG